MSYIPNDIKALEEKISALNEKKKQEEPVEKHTVFSRVATGLRLGVELASGTVVGAGLGYVLDELFDFKFLMLLIFTMFGGCAGMLNAYRYAKSINTDGKKGDV